MKIILFDPYNNTGTGVFRLLVLESINQYLPLPGWPGPPKLGGQESGVQAVLQQENWSL